jgi:uncharacterized protein (TIGR04255 family)
VPTTSNTDVTTPVPLGPFPEAPRVIYQQNPLTEVIFQVKFPPILRIDAELPAGFQERIRALFPLFEASVIEVAPGIPKEVWDVVRKMPGLTVQGGHRSFISIDRRWTLNLAKEFLALQTSDYLRWEDFRSHLEPALNALEVEYKPATYTRIGLRYRNVIRRSALGLGDAPWQELLKEPLTGELAAPDISGSIESATRATLVRLPGYGGKVHIRHGLLTEQDETAYVIDNDFFTESQTESANAFTVLQYFSAQANRLFQWCISPRLHQAMGPQPLV